MEKIAFIINDTFVYWSQIILMLAAVAAAAFYGAFYIKKGGGFFAYAASLLLTTVVGVPLSRLVDWYCNEGAYESFQVAMTDYTQGSYALIGIFVAAFGVACLLRLLQISDSLPQMLDCMALGGSIGIAVGRLSSMFNGTGWGVILPDEVGFPVTYPVENAVSGAMENRLSIFMIQSALAAAVAALLMLYMLWRVIRRKKLPDGEIFLLFLLFYCSCQVICDSPRIDALFFPFNKFVRIVQIFGLVAMLVPVVLYGVRMVRRKGFRWPHVIPWVLILGALGMAGYMEYYVQRNGHMALRAYTIMTASMLVVILMALIMRFIGSLPVKATPAAAPAEAIPLEALLGTPVEKPASAEEETSAEAPAEKAEEVPAEVSAEEPAAEAETPAEQK